MGLWNLQHGQSYFRANRSWVRQQQERLVVSMLNAAMQIWMAVQLVGSAQAISSRVAVPTVPQNVPVLTFDYRSHPELADNIWHAQMAGHPQVLTAGNALNDINRRGALSGIPRILSRDEYPFAFTQEGGGASWIGHIPLSQQWAQGGIISIFIRRHSIRAGRQI